jgi:hypothetical protein
MNFAEATNGFVAGVDELRVFVDRIGQAADAYDKSAVGDFSATIDSIVPAEVNEWLKANDEPIEGTEPTLPDDLKAKMDAAFHDSKNVNRLVDAAKSLKKASPAQGAILRRGAVISLMSHFEALIADIIHLFYGLHPDALPADEHKITLAALRAFGSIDDAVKHVVAQEVDSVLRESLREQLAYLGKRPKLNPKLPDDLIDAIVEVDQRRNLIVHNRGRVNKQYLARVRPELAAKYGAKDGDELRPSSAYLTSAIDDVFLVGLILAQHAWRKWEKDTAAKADGVLVVSTFESLLEGRYPLVVRIAELAEQTGFAQDDNRRIVTINRAIALRELGRDEQMKALLKALDWSASSPRFKLAVAALRRDDDEFLRILPRAVAASEITSNELETWPLFRAVREDQGFWERVRPHLPAQRPANPVSLSSA